MKRKRALFFCTTVYQLLNAINIKKNMLSSEWSADIVMNDSTDFSEIIQRLQKCSIFDNIYQIAELGYYKQNKGVLVQNVSFNVRINRFFSGAVLKKRYRLVLNQKYDALLVPLIDNIAAVAIYGLLSKRNAALRLYEYEEGFGTYAKPGYMKWSISKAEKMLCRITGRKILCGDNVKCTLLYKPALCNRQDIPLRQIPQLKLKDRELYNYIFGYDNTIINQKYLLFNQYFDEDGFNCGERRLFLSLVETIGADNVAIKLHPRSTGAVYDSRLIMNTGQGVPWEVCMMNQDMDDKVMVTVSSSCVYTSKMIFSSKCKVILLFGLPGGYLNMHDKAWNEFVNRFQAEYDGDVLIPKSKEELADMLKELSVEGRR